MRRIKRDSVGWHVIARGPRRLDLFHEDQDFAVFMAILRKAIAVSGAVLWAFTLMSNHYHLVIYASSSQLTSCMRRINRLYARYHNRKYGMTGHAFESPYKAYAQPTPILLLRTIAYVFMNPVAAGLATKPEDYPWTCARDYLAMEGSPLRVDPSKVMNLWKDPSVAWKAFQRAMEREARKPARKMTGVPTRMEIHAQQFEWLLDHARESEDRLRGENPVLVAIYWARASGISVTAMARVLGTHSPGQLSVLLYRFKKELEQDPPRAERLATP